MIGNRGHWIWNPEKKKFVRYNKAKKNISPIFMTDEIPQTWSPVDNKYYTSKTKMRRNAKALGAEWLGGEQIEERKDDYDRESVRQEIADRLNQWSK